MEELFKEQTFTKIIEIDANCSTVWEALTNPKLMRTWMSDSDIDIITDWEIGSGLTIQGYLSGKYFENNGFVLSFNPCCELSYSHLSSLSGLTDQVENYSVLVFYLAPVADQTQLTLTVSNFPTEIIYKHLVFYWNVTLDLFKKFIEGHDS